MTKITSAHAVALIASVSFASAALADGDYYQGVAKHSPAASSSVDRTYTGSIHSDRENGSLFFHKGVTRDNHEADFNSGDYYSGVERAN